ncbi:MAG TPA: right-handed parallel beta-helix repeat-containing protein [Jatrophihabitantaceae bacterium]|nr:right-handed parallel beta-helix repeat-containing protein [Jatrophihabitantaceae bacterium]
MTALSARRVGTLVAALVATAGAFTLNATMASAAGTTRYVATTGNDSENDCTDQANPCRTIVHAVEDEAQAGDTVSIAAGTYPESVRVFQSMTIVGAGSTGSGKTTISGDPESGGISIFVAGIDSAPTVTIRDLDVSGNGDNDGIRVDGGNVSVEDCVVSNNDANGIRVVDQSSATVTGTSVNQNGDNGVLLALPPRATTNAPTADPPVLPSATISHSTINGNNESGVLIEAGEASIDNSTINNNDLAGVDVSSGSATVDTSTLDSNIGAGVVVEGSGRSAAVTNSTISNTKPFPDSETEDFGSGFLVLSGGNGAISNSTLDANYGQGVLSENGVVRVDNSTVSGTVAGTIHEPGQGGVVFEHVVVTAAARAAGKFGGSSSAASSAPRVAVQPGITLTGTIVADNTTLNDCVGTITDGGYNLASDDSCSFSATGSKNSGTAKLGPLADNGGPTLTLKPAKGSDAIDAIPSGAAGCVADATDQRGVSRPQGPQCDIGAVEVDQPAVVISPNSLPNGTVGVPYSVTITATGGLGAPYVWSLAGGALPPGLTFSAAGVISGVPTAPGTYHITVSVDDPTEKDYTIVIVAPTGPSTQPIANTGAHVRPLASAGALAVALGVLMLLLSTALGYRARRYRRVH